MSAAISLPPIEDSHSHLADDPEFVARVALECLHREIRLKNCLIEKIAFMASHFQERLFHHIEELRELEDQFAIGARRWSRLRGLRSESIF
jgi:hypothetical protein